MQTLAQILIGGLALGALCGAWMLFQNWIGSIDPAVARLKRSCGGCSGGETCRTRMDHPGKPASCRE